MTDIDSSAPVLVAGKCDPVTIGRYHGVRFLAVHGGEAGCHATCRWYRPQVTIVAENNS
jgi:hypothetical protein